MTYQEALEFIHGIPRYGSKPGLRRIRMLLDRLGNPQEGLRFVHVAGTNGKGSTCTMISNVLREAGYRTGLYISPFVVEFRERIQVDNHMITKEELAEAAAEVKIHWDALAAGGEPPSEFEVVVACAFLCFLRRNCGVVVLEVGMGGRFDSTNVIPTPLASVITSIGIDHTAYLGDTLEQIAAEKCGIIKEGGVTVTYPRQDTAALAVIMEHCAARGNRLVTAGEAEILSMGLEGTDIRYGGRELHIPLPGEHQVYNALTALETLEALRAAGFSISWDAVKRGIGAAAIPARLEVLSRDPLILLDGAHNESGAKALGEALALLGDRPVHAVMGMMGNKEAEKCLAHVLPRCRSAVATAPPLPNALPPEKLAAMAKAFCPQVTVQANPGEAFREAAARCGAGEVLLLWGSLYLSGELRPLALAYRAGREKQV